MTERTEEPDVVEEPEFASTLSEMGRIRRWTRIALAVIAVTMGAAFALSFRATPDERFTHLLGLSRRLVEDGGPEAAREQLRAALEIRPEDADALYLVGVVERARGNDGEAERALRQALAVAPRHGGASMELGRYLYERGEFGAALPLLDIAAADARLATPALMTRSFVLTRLGAPSAAAADQERLADLRPDDPRPCLQAGYIRDFLRRTDPFAARDTMPDGWFHEALRRARADNAWLVERALAELALGRPRAVLEILDGPDVPAEMVERPEAAAALAMARLLVGVHGEGGAPSQGASPLRRGLRVLACLATDGPRAASLLQQEAQAATPGDPTLLLAEIALSRAARDAADPLQLALDGLPAPAPRAFVTDANLLHGLLRGVPPYVERSARLPWLVLQSALLDDHAERDAAIAQAREDLDAVRKAAGEDDRSADVWDALLEMAAGNSDDARRTIGGATYGTHSARPAALHVSAILHLAAGDVETATAHARESRQLGPPLPARAVSELRALLAANDIEGARRAAAGALLVWPDDVRLLRLARDAEHRAVASGVASQDGLDAIEMRVAVADGNVEAMARLASTRLEEEPLDGAAAATLRSAWRRHAERLPQTAGDDVDPGDLRAARAIAFARGGQIDAALRALPPLDAHPEDARGHLVLAAVRVAAGDPDGALDALRAAEQVAEGAELERVALGIGRALFLLGRHDDSAATLRLLRDNGDEPAVAAAAARALLAHPSGTEPDRAAALAWLESRGDEDEIAGLLLRSALAAVTTGPEDAARHARLALDASSGGLEARVALATALADAGDLDGAEAELLAGLRRSPLHGGVRTLLGVVRMAASDRARARDDASGAHARLASAVCGGRHDTLVAARLAREIRVGASAGGSAQTYAHLAATVPDSAAPQLFLARVHEAAGHPDDATARYAAALEAAPRDPVVVAFAVEFALSRGDATAASAAIPAEGADPLGLHAYLRGRVASARGDVSASERAFRAALATSPGNVAAVARVLETRARRADEEPLDDLLRSTVERAAGGAFDESALRETLSDVLAPAGGGWFSLAANAPSASEVAFGVGQLLTVDRAWPAAARAYETALRLDPAARPTYLQLGTALRRAKNASAAVTRLRELADTQPANPAAWTALGIAHGEARAHPEAANAYRRALAADPSYSLAANNLAWTLSEHLDAAHEAVSVAAPLFAAAPGDPDIADTYGWALHRAGRHEDAVSPLQRACALRERSAPFRLHLARTLDAAERIDEALAAYETARELDRTLAARERVTERILALSAERR